MRVLCLLLLLGIVSPACRPPKSEEVGYYPDGALHYRVALTKDGVYTGLYTSFHHSGSKESELPYSQGHINGFVKRYFPSGQLLSRTLYKNGDPNGEMKSYYLTGELRSQGNLYGKKPVGPLLHYYRNGQLQNVQIHDKRGRRVDFARFSPTGIQDTRYTQPLVYALQDTVQVGQDFTFEVVLACRTSNATQVRFRGEKQQVDSVKGEFSAYRYRIRATRLGRICITGGVLQPRSATTSTWFPWKHCFFVTPAQDLSARQ
jgi:hypothetical protein